MEYLNCFYRMFISLSLSDWFCFWVLVSFCAWVHLCAKCLIYRFPLIYWFHIHSVGKTKYSYTESHNHNRIAPQTFTDTIYATLNITTNELCYSPHYLLSFSSLAATVHFIGNDTLPVDWKLWLRWMEFVYDFKGCVKKQWKITNMHSNKL